MLTEIINTKRFFQIWKYTVGHRQMLFRSTKSTDCSTSIDVLFKGVREFHLPTILTGLSISEASEEEVRMLCSLRLPPSLDKDLKAFKVQGTDFLGYVTALIVVCHEDEGEYDDPSFFDSVL